MALSAPIAANADSSLELGIQDDNVFVNQLSMSRDSGFDAIDQLNAKTIRINSGWSNILTTDPKSKSAPATPTYNFTTLDAAVDAAVARGFKVQLTIFGAAPAWATGNKKIGYYKVNAKRFGRFAGDIANHFNGRVDSYSIWNEPNWPGLLQPQRKCKNKPTCKLVAPTIYRKMYVAAFTKIKKVSSSNKVLIGETTSVGGRKTKKYGYSTSPLEFLRGVFCVDKKIKKARCKGLKADGLAHHPYYLDGPPETKPKSQDDVTVGSMYRLVTAVRKLQKIKALSLPSSTGSKSVKASGSGKVPILATEMAYLTASTSATSTGNGPVTISSVTAAASKRILTESQQASYYKRTVNLLKKTPNVKQVIFYTLKDYETQGNNAWGSAGMIKQNGENKKSFETISKLF